MPHNASQSRPARASRIHHEQNARTGIVLVRHRSAPHTERFFQQVVAGLDDGLAESGRRLLARRVDAPDDELAVYRQWHEQGAVDAVVVKDLIDDDPRLHLLQQLGIPAVFLADVTQVDGRAAVHTDNAQTMRDAMSHLIGCGHRSIARVAGPSELVHTQIRTEAFLTEASAANVTAVVVDGDYSEESGGELTRALLTSSPRPSAIVFDNDSMAVGGLAVAHELGIAVPDDLSLLAWDDSSYCQLSDPPLSALSHDVHQLGVQLSQVLIRLVDEGLVSSEAAIQPVLVQRGTSAKAPVTPAPTQLPTTQRQAIHDDHLQRS